jgi:esterase/lipase superfamily enzyme
MYWLITNRNVEANGFGGDFSPVTYWTAPATANPTLKASWTQVTKDQFRQQLVTVADQFPSPLVTAPKDQKQVTFFIHGYNEAWPDAMGLYQKVVSNLYSGPDSLGECISFDWPSKGYLIGYLPDRAEARKAAQDLANVMADLYDWMLMKQSAGAANAQDGCKAKTSVIAHSMGNYVLENAMNVAWTQKNRPLLVSLIQEAVMVAADVDNDLFGSGEVVTVGNGEGIANLTYRVTALYSGRDAVLGASAGLKHFGKRRLGRSGLDRTLPVPDNVWDIDCSQLIAANVSGLDVHSSYFDTKESNCYGLMGELLRGIDRSVLVAQGLVPPALTKTQVVGS